MASRLNLTTVNDFRGGINLRSDALQLAENEVQLALNVEIDRGGGFHSRKGWTAWNPSAISAPAWDPRSMYAQTWAGTEQIFVSNKATYTGGGAGKGTVLVSSSGTFTPITVGANPLVCAASPHMADFAQWSDTLYIACGHTEQGVKYTGGPSGTLLAALGAGTFHDDYTAPSGATLPKAELYASHQGRLFAAYTSEDGVDHPHRVRWSHPNDPENWASLDFQDITVGGQKITAIIPFSDHLLIFKTDSIWRLEGYDTDSFQLVNVSMKLGAQSRQAVTVTENTIYFFTFPHGVFEYRGDGGVYEASEALRPGIRAAGFGKTPTALDNVWLAYVGQKLWANVPFSLTSIPTDAYTSMVFDPTLSDAGGWTAFRGADDGTVGPMVEGQTSDTVYAAPRKTACVVKIDSNDTPVDQMNGDPVAFQTFLITRWYDNGLPTLNKSWKRPDFLVRDSLEEQIYRIQSYRDYDEARASRAFNLVVPQRAGGFIWGSWTWGDGSLWGAPPQGSRPVRASSLGLGAAMRLRIDGPLGIAWGVDAIIFKTLNKRAT